MISFHLTARSNVPPYVQLVEQVRQALLNGTLRPGDRLPTVKEVVGALAINPNTVLKAYRDLEREGLVEGRQGGGAGWGGGPRGAARACRPRRDAPKPSEQASLARSLTTWVARAQRAGLADADIESM